jgi:hypothetical protein
MVTEVVSFDTTLYGPASTLLGIERAAHDAGCAVSVSSLRSINRATVLAAIQQLRDQGVDGVAGIAPRQAGVDALLPSAGPVRDTGPAPPGTDVTSQSRTDGSSRACTSDPA